MGINGDFFKKIHIFICYLMISYMDTIMHFDHSTIFSSLQLLPHLSPHPLPTFMSLSSFLINNLLSTISAARMHMSIGASP